MSEWEKIHKAPYYLEIWKGRYKTSYRVNWRAGGHKLRKKLVGEFSTWRGALIEADRLIAEAKFGKSAKLKVTVRSETLCDEIVKLKKSKSAATYEQTEIFFRKHIKPYLEQHCPYAVDLNPTVWLNYKNDIRLKNPTVRLFNHWKFFTMLFKYAHQKGLLPAPVKLDFKEGHEDSREKGYVIPNVDFEAMVAAGSAVWRDRAILGRRTGMRPGEIRNLAKDRIELLPGKALIRLRKEDTKTRSGREFLVEAVDALEVIERRMRTAESPYLFPNERDKSRPMDKHLNGWNSMLKKARVSPDYTPHDLRHTYATEMFQLTKNHSALCFQLGMSMEEAQRTYIHIKAADTAGLAGIAAELAAAKSIKTDTIPTQISKNGGNSRESS